MGLIAKLIGKSTTTSEKAEPAGTTGKNSKNKSKFRGVQVNPNQEDCCQVARDTVGSRFLSHEVPMLPLSGCDAVDCQCTYELFEDRRTDFRRAADVAFDILSQLFTRDKRSEESAGRRAND